MEKNIKDTGIVYPLIDNIKNSKYYGFIKVDNGYIFSKYFIKYNNDIKNKFIIKNFRCIADCYYIAMKFDSVSEKNRKRKLITFLKSLWDQNDFNVSFLMIKAIIYLYENGFGEYDIVDNIIKKNGILNNAGYVKKICDSGKYVWKEDENKKFDLGIGKAFILSYINNNFDKNKTWKYIKRHCYLKDGIWFYKNSVTREKINTVLKNYLKDGGIIVEKVNMEFETFVPMSKISKDNIGHNAFMSNESLLSKEINDNKKLYVYGAASTTDVDLEDEYVTENFIKSMKKQAKGLPLKVGSHFSSDLDDTVGVVIDKGGDDKTFEIEGRLQPFEHNNNVLKIAQKMDDGINYGFSIFGRVTKVFKSFNDKLNKEVIALDDGILSHILITDQPCNTNTFAGGIMKSLCDKGNVFEKNFNNNDYKHNSNILKEEIDNLPADLPDQAYPINYKEKKVFKEYPHHYVKDGNLYLHKDMVFKSFCNAVSDKAPDCVITHLKDHLQVIGFINKANEIIEFAEDVDKINDLKVRFDSVSSEIQEFWKSVVAIKKLGSSIEDKRKIVGKLVKEVAPKITEILNDLVEE